jgi:hypothetical protein
MTVNQIEKLKARLATASPAEAKIIKELIQTLEADAPDAVPHRDRVAAPSGQKNNPFLNPRAKWIPADQRTRDWLATFEVK